MTAPSDMANTQRGSTRYNEHWRAGLVLNLNTTVKISEATVMEVEGSQSLHSWLRKLPFLLIALQLTVIYIPIVTYSRIFTAKNSYLSR